MELRFDLERETAGEVGAEAGIKDGLVIMYDLSTLLQSVSGDILRVLEVVVVVGGEVRLKAVCVCSKLGSPFQAPIPCPIRARRVTVT